MIKKEMIAIADSPIHLADNHTVANYSSTLHYIPGSTIRGALASTYLQKVNIRKEINQQLQYAGLTFDDYFNWLFLSGQVCFPNLYPIKDPQKKTLVIPLSARSCKHFGGFSNEWKKHGVFDILLHKPQRFRCTCCDSPMETFSGFYDSDDGQVSSGKRIDADHRTLTRTSIENETESVRQGILYSMEVLEEGEVFSGNLTLSPPNNWSQNAEQKAIEILEKHLCGDGPLSRQWIGSDKTSGLGAIHLRISEFDPPELSPLDERFNRLQEAWGRVPEHENIKIFTITLNSDAIIMDELWRYLSIIDVDVLNREAIGMPNCYLKRWFTGTHIVGGWNTAHGLPKEDELAINKGSAFLYYTTADKEILLPWLRKLEEEGIGERRNEGFGQIIACHPFHWEVAL